MWGVSGYCDCFFLCFFFFFLINPRVKHRKQRVPLDVHTHRVSSWGGSSGGHGSPWLESHQSETRGAFQWCVGGCGAGHPRTSLRQGPKLSGLTPVYFLWCLTLLTMLGVISRATRRPEQGGVCGGSGRERVSLSEVQDLTLDA